VSQASVSGAVGLARARTEVKLYGLAGELPFDAAELDHALCWPVLRREFAAAVRARRPHELDVRRGLYLQELLDQAIRSLT
jgi:hypothetical protein